MRYLSTGGMAEPAGLAEAVRRGLAPDGGLYVPEAIPRLPSGTWEALVGRSLTDVAQTLLAPFAEGALPARRLAAIVREALGFPIPLVPLEDRLFLLELFHGPTLAFKDVGARVMARLLAAFEEGGDQNAPPVTVLVATSGDTGGAVANAFFGLAGTRVCVLYPRGQVSPRQERQFATLGGNVLALAVDGSFDDCQRLAKAAFADPGLCRSLRLSSANSINLGRLLPQMVYYAHALGQLPAGVRRVGFCTPSGNFGNLTAGLIAWRMGLPCAGFVAATNANDVVPEYLATGRYAPRPSIRTLANAMDVGAPSNLARIRHVFGDDVAAIRRVVSASAHDDDAIRAEIRDVHRRTGRVLDPHTAVGTLAARRHLAASGNSLDAVVVLATAHPAKFAETVEPLVGETLRPPPQLAAAIDRPLLAERLADDFGALRERLLDWA